MARSLNKVLLIGNLTRDPELRYTPQGTAVCSFGLATNRQWVTESGERKEDVEFHRLVAWNKLAEICAQLLKKGRKVFVEGRLQTRNWTGQDGSQRSTTEIVVSDMVLLDQKREGESLEDFGGVVDAASDVTVTDVSAAPEQIEPVENNKGGEEDKSKKEEKKDDDSLEDIPF
ncbi:MAG: single-stranded DNA-binding protein [Patescibacteria group bacterium]|nr:MAG: single-stranded DNA-binding protein [Patescibacteria group bacterium]